MIKNDKYLLNYFSEFLNLDLGYFLKGSFWLTFSTLVATLSGIFLSSLFARLWPKDIYGQYSFLVSSLGFLSIFSLSGMSESVFQGSIENKDGVFKVAVKKVFSASLLGTLILILGSIYFYFRDNSNLALAALIAAGAFPFSAMGSLSLAFYKGKKNFRVVSILSIAISFLTVFSTAAALLWFRSLIIVVLFSTWSTALINILVLFKTYRDIKNEKKDEKLIKYGFFTSITGFIWLGLDYADRFFIPLLLGFEKFAIYTFSIFIPNQIQGFFKPITILGQPKVTAISERNIKNALISKSLQLEIIILGIVLLYISLAPFIYKFFFPDYSESIFLSQLFSFTLLAYPNNLFGSYLTKRRLIKQSVVGTLVYAFFSFASLLIFLSLWGLIGAVFSKIFSRVLQVAITQIIFFRELRKRIAIE